MSAMLRDLAARVVLAVALAAAGALPLLAGVAAWQRWGE